MTIQYDTLDKLYEKYNNATTQEEKSALAKKIAEERSKQQFRAMREDVQNKLFKDS